MLIGQGLLVAAGTFGLISAALAAGPARPARSARPGSTAALAGAVVSLWLAVALLTRGLILEDLGLRYVAEQTRSGTGVARRITGLWAGAEGSLLLFSTILASGLLIGHRDGPRWQQAGCGLLTVGLVGATALGAPPFDRLDPAPADGQGMAPILEHGAMLIHPPLLYIGFALALTPGLVRDRERAHRLSLVALAVLTATLAIGASWAYVELGWGGWWAWDPIENVGLIIWLLLAAALHTRVLDPDHQTGTGLLSAPVLWALCWPAVLAGAALTRTSQRTSVHAFADAAQLAGWLWPLAVLAGFGAVLRVAEDRPTVPEPASWSRRAPQAVLAVVAIVVAAGTYRPFVSGDSTAGWFYARLLFPVAVVGLILAVVLPARRFVATGRRPSPAVLLGHGGMALILFAAVAGTASTRSTVRLLEGETAMVDGRSVTLEDIRVTEGQRPTVTALVVVDGGDRLEPSVTLHRDRGLRLPEIPTHSTPFLDTQAILRDVDPELGAQVTIQFRPFNQLVWWGSGLVALSALAARRTGRRTSSTNWSSSTRAPDLPSITSTPEPLPE